MKITQGLSDSQVSSQSFLESNLEDLQRFIRTNFKVGFKE